MLKIRRCMKRSAMSEKPVALIHMPAYGIAVHMPIDFESEYSSGKTSVRYCGKNRGFKDIFKKYEKFAIKYFCENEKVSETVFACSYGAQVESLKKEKNSQKPRDTVPFNKILLTVLYNYIY